LENLDNENDHEKDAKVDKVLIFLCFLIFVVLGYFLALYLRV
jgi:hypothetical protein